MTESAETYTAAIAHIRSVLRGIEKTLLEKSTWFSFSKESSDGRVNSQKDEPQIAEYLLTHSDLKDLLVKKSLKKPSKKSSKEDDEDNRALGDIGINLKAFGYDEPFPCNIKIISEKNTAGNNACGLIPLIAYTFNKSCRNHEDVMDVIIELDSSGYDTVLPHLYGIIMVQKENKKCWVGTFDEVPTKSIGTNPSNPLQVPFLTDRVARTPKEYIDMIITKVVEYHTKKSAPLAKWNAYKTKK